MSSVTVNVMIVLEVSENSCFNYQFIVPGHMKRDCFDFCKSSPFVK
jgi:hypothetical protein